MRWPSFRSGSRPAAAPRAPLPSPAHLQTTDLCLRPAGSADIAFLHRLWTDPAVLRDLWDGHLLAEEQSRDLVEGGVRLHAEQGLGLWLARDRQQQPVGFVGLLLFRDAHELELLYAVEPTCWMRGHARQMAAAMVAYGFDQLELRVLRACTRPDNQASQRVLRRLGFARDPSPLANGKLGFPLPRPRPHSADVDWEAA